MTKLVSIKENRDFRRLYHRGKSFVSPALVVYVTNCRAGFSRLGITAGKKIGKAVKRNRAKRVIREAYRHLLPQFKNNVDLVVVARSRATVCKEQEIRSQLKELLKQAEVI